MRWLLAAASLLVASCSAPCPPPATQQAIRAEILAHCEPTGAWWLCRFDAEASRDEAGR